MRPGRRKPDHARDGWSITEAAKELGFAPSTIKHAIELGQVKTFKPFGLKFHRIPHSEIERVKEMFR